ncbi:MAG: phosphotransferase family protein [Gordonia polyisoprenivorans]|nr:phosphotransferase family protein [Gordonia polyisoprenivorans]
MSETDVVGDLAEIAEVDPVALLGWLRGAGIEWAGTVRCTRVGFGQSNLTYLLTDDADGRWVLRRPPVGTLLASAHDVAREARILAALAPTDVAVPAVLGVCTDESVSPVPLVVMEFVDGVVLDRLPAAQALSPAIRRAVGESMIDTLARIHDVDIEQAGLADLASHTPYAARQLKRWSAQWVKSKTREIPALDELTRRLTASAPDQQETRLVHGDFHIRNVMIDPDSGTVRAALDWELSTLGDPLADIGSTLAYWPAAGEPPLSAAPVELLEGFPTRDELAEMYLDRTGRDARALQFWHALGLWKVAIIAEGVLRRARDNPANRAAAGVPTDEVIDSLVARAIAVADAAGLG